MNRKTTIFLLFLALGTTFGPGRLWAGSQSQAVIAFHGSIPSKGNPCSESIAANTPCSSYLTNLPLMTTTCVYLVVANVDSAAGLLGLSLGIDYNPSALAVTFSAFAHTMSWENSGINGQWPSAGSGTTLTWGINNCQRSAVGLNGAQVVAGYFNVYAYAPDLLQVTDNINLVIDQELRVADCSLNEWILGADAKGSMGFGTLSGDNPCSCAPCVTVKLSNDYGCVDSVNTVPVTVVNCGVGEGDIELHSLVDGVPQTPQQFFGVSPGDSVQYDLPVACSATGPVPVVCDAVIYTVGDSSCTAADTTSASMTCLAPCINLSLTATDASVSDTASVDVDVTNCGTEALDITVSATVDGTPDTVAVVPGVAPSGAVHLTFAFACAVETGHTVVVTAIGDIAGALACPAAMTDSATAFCLPPRPDITSIVDIGNDQGRQVRITFLPSPLDVQGSPTPILSYEIYRRIDPLPAAAAGLLGPAAAPRAGEALGPLGQSPADRIQVPAADGRTSRLAVPAGDAGGLQPQAGKSEPDLFQAQPGDGVPGEAKAPLLPEGDPLSGWDMIAEYPAHGDLDYNVIATTLADSTISAGMHWSVFLVRATTADPYTFWNSLPDSGYSLDNLAPAAPMSPQLSDLAVLSWDESTESDLDYYTVYGSDQDTPGPGTVKLASTNALTMDVSSTPYPFYLITATDYSGNESPAANALSAAATAAGTSVPVQLGPSITMTFDNVTQAGVTTLTPVSAGPSPPLGLQTVPTNPGVYYDLSTTAVFSGNITVCITYDPASVQGAESNLLLFHYDETLASWQDVTSSLNTTSHVICGITSSLSPFAIVEPGSPTGSDPVIPTTYRLYNSYPNPFHTLTVLHYDLVEGMAVRLRVVDLQGRVVKTLVDRHQNAGQYVETWDGTADDGRTMSPGVYFLNLETPSFQATRKVLYLR